MILFVIFICIYFNISQYDNTFFLISTSQISFAKHYCILTLCGIIKVRIVIISILFVSCTVVFFMYFIYRYERTSMCQRTIKLESWDVWIQWRITFWYLSKKAMPSTSKVSLKKFWGGDPTSSIRYITLFPVATSHQLNQCWLSFMKSHGVARYQGISGIDRIQINLLAQPSLWDGENPFPHTGNTGGSK